jgi:hypothetical protein
MDDKQPEPKRDKTDWTLRVKRWVGVGLWYGIGLLVVLWYYECLVMDVTKPLPLTRAILGLVLLIGVFVLIHIGVRSASGIFGPKTAVPAASAAGTRAFPSQITVIVGIWLLIFSAISVAGLLLCLNPPVWPEKLTDVFPKSVPNKTMREVLTTVFAAGVGSCVTTILGYLQHASEDKDFDLAFVPWYVARPVMGMLLGLIFYIAVVGGLVALNVSDGESTLDIWALAGVGALVGLFSKNAVEKLREIFNTMFRTQKDMENQFLKRLPDELQKKVKPYFTGDSTTPPAPGA